MSEPIRVFLYPILFRALQSLLEAAPTLLCGLITAGLMRGVVGKEALRRWFTDDARFGPARACLLGLLLPVCSLGVLPVGWELRRAGVPRAIVLTFLVSAPLTNPFALASSLQTLESQGPWAVGAFLGLLVAALALLAVLGAALGRWLPEPTPVTPDLAPLPESSWQRLLVVGLCAARGLTGALLVFLLIAALGSGLLALIPGGALEQAANDRTPGGPLHMALVALPAQVSPELGGALLCDMMFMGVSLGRAFAFLLLGVGVNLATMVWIAWSYGIRVAAVVMLAVVSAAVAVGYALPVAVPNLTPDVSRSRHFLEIDMTGGPDIAWTRAVKDTLIDDRGEPDWLSIAAWIALGLLTILGLAARLIGERATVRHQMTQPTQATTSVPDTGLNRRLSAAHLTIAGLVAVLVLVVAGLYVAYPSPTAVLDEMNSVQVELNLTLKADPIARDDALRLVTRWQRLQSKLTLGDFLRRGRFNSPLRQPSEELRAGIEQLRVGLVDRKTPDELRGQYAEARKAATRCREALDSGK